MMRVMSESPPSVSVIVPTYREGANLLTLTERLFAAVTNAGIVAELIIVDDDSPDDTEQIAASLGERYPLRLIVRRGERGLSSAVLRGFAEAKYDTFVVMDADLQHPPEAVPDLVSRLAAHGCDFVCGSRHAAGGRIEGHWSWFRRLNSWVATALARPLVGLSDPMSGFFALRRHTWAEAAPLDPIGYKIGLELFIKGRCRHPGEIPIAFGARLAGESKLSMGEQLKYLRHLGRLYAFRYPIAGGIVVFVGVIVVGAGILGVFRWLRFGF